MEIEGAAEVTLTCGVRYAGKDPKLLAFQPRGP